MRWADWTVDSDPVPQQDNYLDCGVFMCSFIEAFVDGGDRVRMTVARTDSGDSIASVPSEPL